MTNQEAFDKVWQYFVVEGHPKAISGNGKCYYRSPDGHKCAAGCLIPDELYNSRWETSSIEAVMCMDDAIALLFSRVDPDLLQALQWAHDQAQRPSFHTDLQVRLRRVAEEFNLPIPT